MKTLFRIRLDRTGRIPLVNGSLGRRAAALTGERHPGLAKIRQLVQPAFLLQLAALGIVLLALASGTHRLSAQTFVRSTSDLPRHFPLDFVVDDVNGDGSLDLVFGYLDKPILTVMTNNGNGTFTFASTNAFPTIWSLFAADVNGDGRLDVIGANFLTNAITIVTNAGDGSFKFCSSTRVARSPQGVAFLDLNSDAKLDLVVTSRDEHLLTLLTNSGTGTFETAGKLTLAATGPSGVIAADLNADGKMDLVTANAEADNLSVLTNAGNGTFGRFDLKVEDFPHRVLAEDINGDGWLDLISANTGAATLTVLTNNRSGKFSRSATLRVGPGPFALVAGDFNRDGWLDLVCADSGEGSGSTVTVLTNNAYGSFTRLATLQVSRAPFFLAAADLNRDDRLDLITFGDSTHTLDVLLNTPDPPFLRLQSSGADGLQLSWSAAWPGFLLLKSSGLPGSWQKVTNPVTRNAGTNTVLVSRRSQSEFYRLIRP